MVFKPVNVPEKKDTTELICPVPLKAPISKKGGGEEPIMRSPALIWSQTSTTKTMKNFVNVERSRVQSLWKRAKELSVEEWKHTQPFCC